MTADISQRRIEEALVNAWPALHQVLLDGWLLRFAKGFTKRANSVTPLYSGSQAMAAKVRHCENLYARERLQSIFRLNPASEQGVLDDYLRRRGYRRLEPSLVLTADLAQAAHAGNAVAMPSPAPHWFLLPQDEWLQRHAALTGASRKFTRLHGAILNAVRTDCAFAALRDGEHTLACGLGMVESSLLGLFDIVTHPQQRRQGWGEALVRGLMGWGSRQGAAVAYLQVAQDNEAAKALYAKLGFQERYPYWYRVAR